MDEQGGNNSNNMIAPFVLKTYEMVSDPSTDDLISWGRANNSFLVLDPLMFSQKVLPSYFKHNNFPSFVRQLNTYGFRKVDPDNWEFANEWFLRGQKRLLKNISRRKHPTRPYYQQQHQHQHQNQVDQLDEHSVLAEIERLREEQRDLDEEVKGMHRRLEATERRPQQMMEFLNSVTMDPDILPRVIMERCQGLQVCDEGPSSPDKRRRLLTIPLSSSSSSSIARCYNSEEADESTNLSTTISSPGLEMDTFGYGSSTPSPNSLQAGTNNGIYVIGQIPNYTSFTEDKSSSYPFSLFGSGF